MGKILKRRVYTSEKPTAWNRLVARFITGTTIGSWALFVLGLSAIAMKPSHPLGYIVLLVGLLAIPSTILAIKVWNDISRAKKGVVLDEEGVTLYGDFVSWYEIREVRKDPDEGYILVFRPDNDATESLCFLSIGHFPHLGHFLKRLQARGIEIMTHRH